VDAEKKSRILLQLSLGAILNHDKHNIAHAWIKSNDIEVVEKGGDYTELFLF
jgi:hypothetical protein